MASKFCSTSMKLSPPPIFRPSTRLRIEPRLRAGDSQMELKETAIEGAELTNCIGRLRDMVEAPLEAEEDSSAMSLADDPELIRDFVLESREHLESIESQVLTLDREGANMEAVHSVFRSFHTIKGIAGFLGFDVIQH